MPSPTRRPLPEQPVAGPEHPRRQPVHAPDTQPRGQPDQRGLHERRGRRRGHEDPRPAAAESRPAGHLQRPHRDTGPRQHPARRGDGLPRHGGATGRVVHGLVRRGGRQPGRIRHRPAVRHRRERHGTRVPAADRECRRVPHEPVPAHRPGPAAPRPAAATATRRLPRPRPPMVPAPTRRRGRPVVPARGRPRRRHRYGRHRRGPRSRRARPPTPTTSTRTTTSTAGSTTRTKCSTSTRSTPSTSTPSTSSLTGSAPTNPYRCQW